MTRKWKCFILSRKDDQCWVPLLNCLGKVEFLVKQGHGAHTYASLTKEFDYFSNELFIKVEILNTFI